MSDVTLSAAVRNSLLSLQRTTSLINRTNGRLASGLKVASPIDDPVAYFSSKALKDRATDFTDRKDGIDQGISTVSTALNGVDGIDTLVHQLKGIATSLKSATGTQFTDLVSQFNEVRGQIGELAADTQYQGVNLIDNTSEHLVVNFSTTTTAKLTVVAQNLRESGMGINGLELRADSKVSFTQSVDLVSGFEISNGNTQINLTQATSFSSFGNSVTITYNGTGVNLDSAGSITFSLDTANSVKVTLRAITGDSFTLTPGQTLTVQLTTVADGFSDTSVVADSQFNASTGTILGVVSGATQALVQGTGAVSATDVRVVNTAGLFQSGVNFIAEGLSADTDSVLTVLDSALAVLRSSAQTLGSNVALLQARLDFTTNYVTTLDQGSSKLTLADLNEEGANLLALQTRQQLGISALSFAGQSEQGILSLFR